MQYTQLGRSGVKVSRLCLGTMNFGPVVEEADAQPILAQALDRGLNFFDTADVYGWHKGKGLTEAILGRWFAEDRSRRDRVVLATKVYAPMGDRPNQRGLSAWHIVRACEDSLRRLQTDRIDLYQMHHVDRDTSWEEIWQAMATLIRQGKVLYVGSSNFAGWHIAQAQEAATARHLLGLVTEQTHYNLAVRQPEAEVLPACRHYGLGLIPWSPLYGGVLAGALGKAAEGRRAGDQGQQRLEQHRQALEAYEALCAERGVAPADVALAWLLANPVVTAPIIGPRTSEQLDGAIAALDVKLDEALRERLNEIWPGPRGEAPEANQRL